MGKAVLEPGIIRKEFKKRMEFTLGRIGVLWEGKGMISEDVLLN